MLWKSRCNYQNSASFIYLIFFLRVFLSYILCVYDTFKYPMSFIYMYLYASIFYIIYIHYAIHLFYIIYKPYNIRDSQDIHVSYIK